MPRRQPPDYFRGYAPGLGLALRIYWAKGRTQGIAQKCKRLYGGAEPPPNIRRQSRSRTNGELLAKAHTYLRE
jgi:hypothetical protein